MSDQPKGDPNPGPGVLHDFDCTHNPCRCRVTTYEEWRVTGTPRYKASVFAFSGEQVTDPEAAARGFLANATAVGDWADGPHLHKRTVTVTDWEEADLG